MRQYQPSASRKIVEKLTTFLPPLRRDRLTLSYALGIVGLLIFISTPISLHLVSSIFTEVLIVLIGVIFFLAAFFVHGNQRETRIAADLYEVETRYKRIFDGALEGIYQTSREGRVLSVNPAMVSMLGYDSAEKILSSEFDIARDFYFDAADHVADLNELSIHGRITDKVIKVKKQDGSAIWLSTSVRGDKDDDGNIVYSGFIRDVTEAIESRRQAEENQLAFRISEQRNRTLIETIPDMMIWFSAEGHYQEVILRDWFTPEGKYSAEQVIGKHVNEVVEPEKAHLILSNLHKAIETGETQTYRWGPSIDGTYAIARATPSADGNVLVISHDITEEVLTAAALLRRDAILSAIGFSTEQLLRTNDWQDVICSVLERLGEASNVASVGIYEVLEPGEEEPEIIKRHQWLADAAMPPTVASDKPSERKSGFAPEWYTQLRNDDIVHIVVDQLPDSLMATRLIGMGWLEIVLIPIKVSGVWWGYIAFDIDSAEHTWSPQEHEALRIAAANLGAAIERKQTQQAFLEIQKSESIGVLAGGIAHDFNNLLTGVIGQSSLAEAKLGADHPVTKHVERAVRSAKKAANLTKQLLAYAGKGQIIVLPVELNQLVIENVELFATAIPANVLVSYSLDAVDSVVVADKVHMQQLIMNLVINAGDAMIDLGGELNVTSHNEYLTEPMKDPRFRGSQELAPGTYFVLVVSDTGIGMSDLTVSKIFDPYFSTKETGHGLGLSAILGIVNTLGGALQIQTAIDEGTTFSVWLPINGQNTENQPHEVDLPTPV